MSPRSIPTATHPTGVHLVRTARPGPDRAAAQEPAAVIQRAYRTRLARLQAVAPLPLRVRIERELRTAAGR